MLLLQFKFTFTLICIRHFALLSSTKPFLLSNLYFLYLYLYCNCNHTHTKPMHRHKTQETALFKKYMSLFQPTGCYMLLLWLHWTSKCQEWWPRDGGGCWGVWPIPQGQWCSASSTTLGRYVLALDLDRQISLILIEAPFLLFQFSPHIKAIAAIALPFSHPYERRLQYSAISSSKITFM